MTGFIVSAPSAPETETPIVSGSFWPAVDPSTIRDAQRIDSTITAIRLRATLIEAIAATNGELKAWREQHLAQGIATLAEIDAGEIDGVSIAVHRYLRAVGCHAKALLLERMRDFDSTGHGDKKTEALTDPIDDHWRDYRRAIADITGAGRCTIELI